MRLFLFLLFTIHGLLISSCLFSQSVRPIISKEPGWITKNILDYNKTSLEKDAADGYINISYEKQVSLADQSEYLRQSKKIISQAGVQNGSQISISFDPSYQQLIFHDIHIIRKAETINKLQLSNIKTIQKEKDLTNFIYDGTLDALIILEDVRQDDIIEYSYTIKGFNPIFKNKYAAQYDMNFAVPLYEIYYKLIIPPGRKMNVKNLNMNLQPKISLVNGHQVYEWRKSDIPPLLLQDYTVLWFAPYAWVLVSEYNSWKEVNDWAMELFPVKKTLSTAVQKKIKEIETEYSGNTERTGAALKFVQDDIRYMGIEMGVNSHKPADPSKVFAQRFGDCKEKSFLLCCMLRAMHIDASPVLINTVSKKNINSFLPAPINFDHTTVRVKLDGVYYWFDPTIAYQRGDIKNIFFPDYQAGLVITDSTSSITPITFRNISSQHVKEYFKVPAMAGEGTLTVTCTFKGSEADEVRSDFNNQSIPELMLSYRKFYAAYYEDIKADSLTYTDDEKTGVFRTIEYYTIPNFWVTDKDKVNRFSFSHFIIKSILRRPKEKDRKMPFELLFPAKYKEEIIIDLPQEWKVDESEKKIKNSCYTYNYKFYSLSNRVHLDAEYENYKDHVTIEEATTYFKNMNEYDDTNSFELTLGEDNITTKKSSDIGTKNILYTILFIGIIIGGMVWWSQRK